MTTRDRNHVTACTGLSAGLALPSHWQLLSVHCSSFLAATVSPRRQLPWGHITQGESSRTWHWGRKRAQPTCLPVATAEGLAFPIPPCWLPRLVLLEPGARWTGHQYTPGREVTCPTAQALPGSLPRGKGSSESQVWESLQRREGWKEGALGRRIEQWP